MDCRNALAVMQQREPDILEDDSEWTAAVDHVERCADCQGVLGRRDETDRALGQICRDVPIPVGLEERLLQAVKVELDSPPPQPAAKSTHTSSQPRSKRRRWLAAAAGLACLLLGLTYLLQGPSASPETLTAQAGEWLDLPDPGPMFVGKFNPQQQFYTAWPDPPNSMTLSQDSFRRLSLSNSGPDIAIAEFFLSTAGGRMVRGAVIIAPSRLVSPRPQATDLSQAQTRYKNGLSYLAWQSGDFVVVCIVEGGEEPLRDLQRSSRAATT